MTREEMEVRRLTAARLFAFKITQGTVARRLGVSRTTASRWYRIYVASGETAMRKRKAPGRPRVLPMDQIKTFMRTPRFRSGKHTTGSIAVDIYEYFGIRYNHDHVGRLLHRIGMEKQGRRWVWV